MWPYSCPPGIRGMGCWQWGEWEEMVYEGEWDSRVGLMEEQHVPLHTPHSLQAGSGAGPDDAILAMKDECYRPKDGR